MLLHMHRSVICAWQLYYASTTRSCFILQVVIAYSCGMCALWDLKRKVTEGRFFHNNREDIVSSSTNYSSTCIHLGTSFIFCVDLYPGFLSQIFVTTLGKNWQRKNWRILLVLLDDKSSWSFIFLVPRLMLTIVQKMNIPWNCHIWIYMMVTLSCVKSSMALSLYVKSYQAFLPDFTPNLWDKIWNRKQGYEVQSVHDKFCVRGTRLSTVNLGSIFFSRRFWRVCAGWAMARTSHAPTVMGA